MALDEGVWHVCKRIRQLSQLEQRVTEGGEKLGMYLKLRQQTGSPFGELERIGSGFLEALR